MAILRQNVMLVQWFQEKPRKGYVIQSFSSHPCYNLSPLWVRDFQVVVLVQMTIRLKKAGNGARGETWKFMNLKWDGVIPELWNQ